MPDVPYGECQCGCGQKTRLAPKNNRWKGWVKGEPTQFVNGHQLIYARAQRTRSYRVDDDTGCWVWVGATQPDGYIQLTRNGREIYAHRWHYEQVNGPIPAGYQLDHLCRNRSCVNPAHLEVVTHAQNVQRGDTAKLSATQVRLVYLSAEAPSTCARRFGVSRQTVWHIRSGRTWRNVTKALGAVDEAKREAA